MQVELVLTAVARDRPGVVEALADVVARHSGNWIDSSMTRLGGEFAGIVRIAVPEGCIGALEQALADLSKEGVDITLHKGAAALPAPKGHTARLELTGLDHTGIVLEVTRALAHHGVNIDDLETHVFPGSMGGEPMFSAKADVVLPANLDTDDLRDALELIANDIMVEIELTEAVDA
jgi:glycine cleavage system regulatory protein